MRRVAVAVFAAALLCCTGLIQAQVPGQTAGAAPQLMTDVVSSDTPPNMPEWGTGSRSAYVVAGFSFNNLRDAQHGRTSSDYIYKSGGTSSFFDQTVHLPTGALVDGVTTYYYDKDATANVGFYFYRDTGSSGVGFTSTLLLSDFSSGSSGYQGGYDALATPETIRNFNPGTGQTSWYLMVVSIAPSASIFDLTFGGATVWYSLQVSPAPGTATFTDVPTGYWAFRYIEALAASGITGGCGGGLYCPESYVKRSEIAVFLAKALGLHWPDSSAL